MANQVFISGLTHKSVLEHEIFEYLNPKKNENFIDATCDGGGHSFAILKKTAPRGKVLGIDLDSELISKLKIKIKKEGLEQRFMAVQGNYRDIKTIAGKNNFFSANGILLDLGFSSYHLESSGRGFSFKKDEPLDMRFGTSEKASRNRMPLGLFNGGIFVGGAKIKETRRYSISGFLTASSILNEFDKEEIFHILKNFGEERYARQISRAIVEERKKAPIERTRQLVEIIEKAVPWKYKKGRRHFATKTFQALRIAVNDELGNLTDALPQTLDILTIRGRIAVISFHSLEDRIVKNFFKTAKKAGSIKIITKKPVRPLFGEVKENPRSRSAKLRVAEKISNI